MAGGFLLFNSKDIQHDLVVLSRMYGQLPVGLKRKHVRAAMKRGLKPHLGPFRRAAPKRTGQLRKSVWFTVDFHRVDGSWTGRAGYGRKKGANGRHAHLVAFGTKERFTKGGFFGRGASRGKMPPNPALEQAAITVRRSALPELYTQLGIALERAYRELPNYVMRSAKSRMKRGR